MAADAPSRLRALLEMIRFSHTLFALPFALLAAVMAWTANAARRAAGARCVAGTAGHLAVHGHGPQRGDGLQSAGRSAASTPLNPRTRSAAHAGRHCCRVASVALFAVADCGRVRRQPRLLFLPNRCRCICRCRCWCFCWPTAMTKRFTALAHFWLGAALMLAPIAAWIAIRGEQVGAIRPICCRPGVGRGRAALGRRLRHDLRLPGRRVRHRQPAAQRAGPAGRGGASAPGGALPPGHDPALGCCCRRLSAASAGFTGAAWRPWPCCFYEHGWCGPTI